MDISTLVNVEGQLFTRDLARRVRWVAAQVRARGFTLKITEGYRPVGVPADQYVLVESKTSTGGSNQWFQWGRMNRGETPEAAYPGTSPHGRGEAVDWDTNNMAVRSEYMRLAGLGQTIASESWHAAIVGPPLVNIPEEGGFLMALTDAEQNKLKSDVVAIKKITGFRLLRNEQTGETYAVNPIAGGYWHIPSPAVLSSLNMLGIIPGPDAIETVHKDNLAWMFSVYRELGTPE